MTKKIKIAVDAMGGENSPKKVIDAILENTKKNKDIFFNIFGDENIIKNYISKKLDKNIVKAGILKAKTKIEDRLKGKRGYDLWWAKKSSFGKIKVKRVLSRNNKFKFLIANHSFIDSPHVYGKNLFPDFFEWLKFLEGTQLLTIGPQTSETCKKIFGRVDMQALKYTFEGLLDAAIDIFN